MHAYEVNNIHMYVYMHAFKKQKPPGYNLYAYIISIWIEMEELEWIEDIPASWFEPRLGDSFG